MRALELIIGVRSAVMVYDWPEAVKWYERVPLSTLNPLARHVEIEGNNNIDDVYDIMHIDML